jgi:hypothetical protein
VEHCQSWVRVGGAFDHCPIMLQIEKKNEKPPSPFKFNHACLEEDEFKALITSNWKRFYPLVGDSAMLQFASNLKRGKKLAAVRGKQKKEENQVALRKLELDIVSLFTQNATSVFSVEELESLRGLERKKKKLLELEKTIWRFKSRAIWLEKGDNNNNFFDMYASHRELVNMIWDLDTLDGSKANTFKELVVARKGLFWNLFKEPETSHIVEQMRIIYLFPELFNPEMNESLDVAVTKEEIKEVLLSLKKAKRPGPYDWTIEFYISFYDFMEDELLRVVKEPRVSGKIMGALNSTFLVLIPNKNAPVTFEDFHPISLCNLIYKLISKITANRIKGRLSKIIS